MTGGDPRRARDGIVPGAGVLGMRLFLATLSVLFVAAIVGFELVRSRGTGAPAAPSMPLPAGMWVATAILIAGSVVAAGAARRIRAGDGAACTRRLALALVLALVFLAVQSWNWRSLIARHLTARSSLEAFTFFMLTGLHAAHVIGGIVLLTVVVARSSRGRYDADRHGGVRYTAMYWHFLDAIWLLLFAVLALGGAS